ncbi:TMEM175 family protein [Enterococcus phoeniculicola]|uniref:Integral membrane protein n=1 Tax=Enterococcus phoeniculicola ATCC BAA-412 TaxID=1158610 RepID=R3WMZ6_9ENTE|nr:TMEM175 family protein [Enterococcus phoeniculicola]EOL49231.1 hypothetical protein UC3_00134 [Enterococcus phoeniculicola ATCC BAA-412]EOT71351.1 hypothetical protein I589_03356 [Enterococcus phoeniculicola ATCC BAA-412]
MSKTRIEAFTDAVIAIIMTILVLELKAPEKASWSALAGMEHKILIYIVIFITLGIYWNNHHHMFQVVHKIDGRVLWANNFLIFSLSLFPFSTAWIGDHLYSWAPEATYGFIVLLANFAYYILAKELVRANGHQSTVATLFKGYRKMYLSIALNVVALLLGWLIAPICVLIVNVLILFIWLIPEKKVEIHYKEN